MVSNRVKFRYILDIFKDIFGEIYIYILDIIKDILGEIKIFTRYY